MPYKMIINFAPSPMWMSKYDEKEKTKIMKCVDYKPLFSR
jgi:hypothetical protein